MLAPILHILLPPTPPSQTHTLIVEMIWCYLQNLLTCKLVSFCCFSWNIFSFTQTIPINAFFLNWQMSTSHPFWMMTMMILTQSLQVLPQQPRRSIAQSPVTRVPMWSLPLWAGALRISLRSRLTHRPLTSWRQPSYGMRVLTLYLQNRTDCLQMDFCCLKLSFKLKVLQRQAML